MKQNKSYDDFREKLTPLQYEVTQNNQTELPYQNEYWKHYEEGVYVDVVSGEALFSSIHKYNSGSGWPSFTKPINRENIVETIEESQSMIRTEVRSKGGGSHLGHVFKDGPEQGLLRYCINSASIRFVPKHRLEEEGYGDYIHLFHQ